MIKDKKEIKFIFWGSGNFSVVILKVLFENNIIPSLIVTTPDKPAGRGLKMKSNIVKSFAEEKKIDFVQPERLKEDFFLPESSRDSDFFIIAGYGKIIPANILKIPRYGTLNIHPSLLPKFRGPSPIQSFILSGEKETGVTIILADEEIDHGPIIAQKKISVFDFPNINYKELEEKLAETGAKLLIEIIPKFLSQKIKPKEQDHTKATFTKKISKEDGLISPEDSFERIERKIRAFNPWPGAYIIIDNKRIIITKAVLENNKIKILTVKPEGKKEMDFESFRRGYPQIVSKIWFINL